MLREGRRSVPVRPECEAPRAMQGKWCATTDQAPNPQRVHTYVSTCTYCIPSKPVFLETPSSPIKCAGVTPPAISVASQLCAWRFEEKLHIREGAAIPYIHSWRARLKTELSGTPGWQASQLWPKRPKA